MSNNSDFKCRQNWSKLCEEKLNIQINLELLASYNYFYLSSFFGRDDIGLKKLVEYFNKASLEEREHSQIMIDYQNKRGGIVNLNTIQKPCINLTSSSYECVYEAFLEALKLEKKVNQNLLELHSIGDNDGDAQFCDFLEGEFLKEQVDGISELSQYISQLEMIKHNNYAIWEFVNKL
jgi:ferritin heavy chain|tara:strand:- start:128 stop:661 length:534 start_codon:yes stop_codon:yes gene_type:complete